MKVRLTIMTENETPVDVLDKYDNPEEKIKKTWDAVLALVTLNAPQGEEAYVEKVEIVREEKPDA